MPIEAIRTRRWRWTLVAGLSVYGPSSAWASLLQAQRAMTEDRIFDAVRQPPIALLRQFYDNHRVLA